MSRFAYTLLWWLALWFLPLRLWWRGRREPGYRSRIGERFGHYGKDVDRPNGDVLWLHAVSLGETRAASPLVARLLRERPEATLLLTHMTATGRDAGRMLYGDRVVQTWLPYDLPFAVRRFLRFFRPCAGLLMETEMWPNLIEECVEEGVPMFLLNARLSARSARGYARLPGLARPMFGALSGVAAQSADDAQRLAGIGAREITVTGNLKFDLAIPDAALELGRELRARFGADRPVFIAAQTREGEEALLLDALAAHPLPEGSLTVFVPRHPQRFEAVGELLHARGLPFVRRSDNRPVPADVAYVLGDSMGELLSYYAASDVAFVGGSLKPLGGQNLIEPIVLGVPTIVGEHTFNFAEAARAATACGAAVRAADAEAVVREAASLLADPRRRASMRALAAAFHAAHCGAVDRTWHWLAPRLPAARRE
jgi:3-deoxy-D-manno-octulosonic-acid transferase